jgi:hypothetical protein
MVHKRVLTVSGDGNTLHEAETVFAFKCGDFTVGKFSQELRFFVVYKVNIILWTVKRKSTVCCDDANLNG